MKPTAIFFILCLSMLTLQSADAQKVKSLKPILEVYGTTLNYPRGERLGTCVASVGDINGDSWPDFAVAAGGSTKLQVYFGGPGILDGIPDIILKGGGKFITGDYNGDGILDIASSIADDTVFMYFGKSTPGLRIDTHQVVKIPRPERGSIWGTFLAAGDLNSDGKDELVVVNDVGQAYIYLGKDPWLPVPDYIVKPRPGWDPPLLRNAYIADIDGDGFKDLMLAINYSHGLIWYQELEIFRGSRNWTFNRLSPDQILRSEFDIRIGGLDRLKFIFAYFNDLRHLGKADASVGRENELDTCFLFTATTQLYPAKPDGFRLNPDHQLWSSIGMNAYNLGDINRDGWDDFAWGATIGVACSVQIYPGGPNGIASSYPSRRADCLWDDGTFGEPTVGIGDVNGDGVNDILAASWTEFNRTVVGGYFAVYSGDTTIIATPVESAPPRPAVAELNAPYPNPSRDGVVIGYTLPAFQRVRIGISDALGREIRVLENDFQHAGAHNIIWNGSTRHGTRAAPGLYFCRLESGGAQSTRRVTLLR